MKMDLKSGAALASAVAALLGSAVPAHAEDKDKATPKTLKCASGNECKGKGACSGTDNTCGGKNECKGKGWVEVKSKAECTKLHGKIVVSR